MLVVTSSIRTWVLLTASAVTARPHGLHSNVSSDNSAWNAVRASCIVSPQHGQATYSYSRIFDCPRTHARQRRLLYPKFSQFGGDIVGECLANDRPGRREAALARSTFTSANPPLTDSSPHPRRASPMRYSRARGPNQRPAQKRTSGLL